jgi:hypothetical protein
MPAVVCRWVKRFQCFQPFLRWEIYSIRLRKWNMPKTRRSWSRGWKMTGIAGAFPVDPREEK